MEPIGQKVVIPSSEEIVVASDLDDNSLENLDTKFFDETLDGALAELHVGDELIDDLLDHSDKSDSLKSVILSNNKLDLKIFDSEMSSKDIVDSDIALEVMEEIMLSDDVSPEKTNVSQKNENFTPAVSEAKEIRIEKNETILDLSDDNVEKFNKDNHIDGKKYDVSENHLQTFFHVTNSQVGDSDLPEEFSDNIVKKYDNERTHFLKSNSELHNLEAFQSESLDLGSVLPEEKLLDPDEKLVNPDFFANKTEIIHPKFLSKSEEKINESELEISLLESESDQNISNQSLSGDNNEIVGGIKSVLESKESDINERLTTLPVAGLDKNKDDLNKVGLVGVNEGKNFRNINEEEFSQNFENPKTIKDFGINGNLTKKEIAQLTNNNIFKNQIPLLKRIASNVATVETRLLDVSQDPKLVSKEIKNNLVQAPEMKNFLGDGDSVFKGRVNEVLKGEDKLFKFSAGEEVIAEEKLSDVSLPLKDRFKISEDQEVVAKEKLNGISVPLKERLKVSEEQEVVIKEKLNLNIRPSDYTEVSKDKEFLAKGKEIANLQGMNRSAFGDIPILEGENNSSDIKIAEKEFSKEFTEKASTETQTNPRNLSSKEIEFPTNTKSFSESSSSIVFNSNSDATSISGVKVVEATNPMPESLRNLDVPFNVEQILNRVRVLRGNGVEEMTLRLNPEELGQITLKIRQSGSDLTIDMRVDNLQAKQLVESGFDSLRNRFLDNEFSYQDLALNVDINERNSQFGRGKRDSEYEENLSSVERTETQEIKNEEEKVQRVTRSDTGLNLYV